ncbi:hypothetical protein NQ315_014305 [Exocentrus adspersus]|uniref:DUF659 domain-containing protein n=1 Tax=Exocentrus adspersus TaxID=1586481 RepID=A0AAV8VIQ9_9CUCU|nr:hypothetical protein NQ315_014305 [Exocentrus adspersus]
MNINMLMLHLGIIMKLLQQHQPYNIPISAVDDNTPETSTLTSRKYFGSASSKRKSSSITTGISKKTKRISDYFDTLKEQEEQNINKALGKFVFGCNLPFSVVESPLYRNFIRTIRPAYEEKIPGRKKLSTTLLNDCYRDCINKASCLVREESVILCDGWTNSSTNSKIVVTMLHSTDGSNAFISAWDCTLESETGEKLAEIITESKTIAKEK